MSERKAGRGRKKVEARVWDPTDTKPKKAIKKSKAKAKPAKATPKTKAAKGGNAAKTVKMIQSAIDIMQKALALLK